MKNTKITLTKETVEAFTILVNVYSVACSLPDFAAYIGKNSTEEERKNIEHLVNKIAIVQHDNDWCKDKNCAYKK